MSNRRKIERFCKKHNIELISCDWRRESTVVPECVISYVSWFVKVKLNGIIEEYESGGYGDTTAEEVDLMLERISDDIGLTRLYYTQKGGE